MDERRWKVGGVHRVSGSLLLTLATIACSGSHAPAVGAAFATKVEALCQTALEQKRAQGPFPYPDFNPTQPDLSKLPGIAEFEARTATIFQTWQQKMVALGQPPTGQAEWADLLDALSRHVQIIVEQHSAASRSDGQTFTTDYHEGNQAQDEMVRAASAAGVPDCATAAGA